MNETKITAMFKLCRLIWPAALIAWLIVPSNCSKGSIPGPYDRRWFMSK